MGVKKRDRDRYRQTDRQTDRQEIKKRENKLQEFFLRRKRAKLINNFLLFARSSFLILKFKIKIQLEFKTRPV